MRIRIHANGSDNSSISGALTICTTRNSPYISSMYRKTKLSLRLYSMHMCRYRMQKRICLGNRLYDRNNWSKSSTIIEMGYMSNPSEDRRMQQSSYQKNSTGIANGIENYLIK